MATGLGQFEILEVVTLLVFRIGLGRGEISTLAHSSPDSPCAAS